jgi:hypothetical protein
MTDDKRKRYMLTTAANFFSKDPEDFKQRYADDKSLNKFLDDLSVLALILNGGKEITFTTRVKKFKQKKI